MANLLSRLRRGEDIWRSGLTVSQYIQQVLASGQVGYSAPYVSYGVDGRPVERLQASFESYAQDIYAAHPVIFGLMEARRAGFSEARFCWRAVKNGNPGDVLPINDGLELLEKPWEGAQTGTLLNRMRQDADLGGTAYLVRERVGRGEPPRLRRLRPDWVQIVLSGNPWEDLHVDFLGITYAPNGPDNNPVEAYLPDEVALWAPIPDALAQFRGISWLTPVIRELQADKAATEHRLSHLKQGAWLGPIVRPPVGTSLEQFKRFVEAADSAHSGPNNAGKMVFLAPGSEIDTVASSLKDLDIKAITGAVETRLAVAARVPAVIAGISEGLQGSSLNAGNYNAAKRAWIDGSLRPDWRSLCEALAVITPPPDLSKLDLEPGTEAQLWILESDIALLHEDRLEAAQVRSTNATTINTLITAGYTPDSIVLAVRDDDLSQLKHSGLTSVQLTPPGMGAPGADGAPEGDVEDPAGEQQYQQALAELRNGQNETARAVRSLEVEIRRAQQGHTGAMVALVPSDEVAERLALDDGEPVDDLHLTLFYLGDARDIPVSQRKSIVDTVRAVVKRRNVPELGLNAFGAALWNPQGDEPAWVLNVGDPDPRPAGQEPLGVLRRAVQDALAYGAPEFRMPRQHSPWSAHVCLAYGADASDADELADRTGPVVFDRIRIAFGVRVTDIPLRGGEASRSAVLGDPDDLPDDDEAFRAAVATFREAVDIERADFYNIRWPKGTPLGGRWRSVGAALERWLNYGDGGDTPLRDFDDGHLRTAAQRMGVSPGKGSGKGWRDGLERKLMRKALSDAAAQRRETEASSPQLGSAATPPPGTRREVPGGYIVREEPERNIWRQWYRSDPPPAPQPSFWAVHRDDGTLVGHVNDPTAARDLLGGVDVPVGTRVNLGYEVYAIRTADGWSVYKPDGTRVGTAATVDEARELADRLNRERLAQVDASFGQKAVGRPVTPMTTEGKTPRQLTDREKVADALAAGRISKAQAIALLTGKAPGSEDFDAEAAMVFVKGLVHAGYITELAWAGDRERLEAYLRRQNTATLVGAAPFFSFTPPRPEPDMTPAEAHTAVVDAFLRRAMELEGPPQVTLPTRAQLMSRKVVDLRAALRDAGLPTSGTKAVLVDRLLAALTAAGGTSG